MAVPITSALQAQVAQYYIAILGRNPDPDGFGFWVNRLAEQNNTPAAQNAIVIGFANESEFKGQYGAKSTTQAVTELYENVLLRAPDQGGLNFWSAYANNLITSGQSPVNAYALTAAQIIAMAAVQNNSDSAGIIARTAVAVAAGEANPTTTFTLTTGIDTFTGTNNNDVFSGLFSNNANGEAVNQTLNPLDRLDGAGGINTLNAQIKETVTPIVLSNIQIVNASMMAADKTLGLVNAGQLTTLSDIGSQFNSTYTGLAASAVNLNVRDALTTALTTTFTYTSTTGTQTVNLGVSGLANVDADRIIMIDGIETLNVTATGNASFYQLDADAATSINFAGASAQTVASVTGTVNVSSFNAAATTGGISLTVNNQTGVGTANVSATGGAGNDTITLTAQTTNDNSVSGGAGNDTFVFATNLTANTSTATNNDTVDGGNGFDTVSAESATLAAINNTVVGSVQSISGIEAITSSDALANSLVLSRIQAGIQQVNTLGTVTGAGYSITFDSGIAGTVVIGPTGVIGNTLTVVSAGSGTTDSLSIANGSVDVDVFNAKAIVATGAETLTLNGNTSTTRESQDVDTITATSGTTAVAFAGNNTFTAAAITAGTVNASGLTGTAALTQSAATVGVTSILGSANADTLIGSATATSIDGGAGNDTITGGVAADLIAGGEGNDSINGAGGNDTISGGGGADTITVDVAGSVSIDGGAGNDIINVTNTLNTGDVINGGDGVNTLAMSTALIANFAGVTNIQTLQLTAATSQNASFFTGTTLTRVNAITGANTVTNASALLNGLFAADAVTTFAFARATNTATDTLTVGSVSTTTGGSGFGITVNNEDTLNFVAGSTIAGQANTITLDGAIDVDTINISGIANQSITAASTGAATGFGNATANATRTITVNASTSEGTVVFNGSTAGAGQTLIITGSAQNDTLTGGAANDVISGGSGDDSIDGGSGADLMTGGSGADDFVQVTGSSIAATSASKTTAVALGNGDVITFSNNVDVIVGFVSGTDDINTTTSNSVSALAGELGDATLTDGANYFAVGTYDQLTGAFTFNSAATASTANVATLVLADATADAYSVSAQTGYVVLLGVAGVVNGDFI